MRPYTVLIALSLLILPQSAAAQEMQTRIFQLRAASVESLIEIIRTVLSPQGTAAPEPRLNKLVVRDTQEVLDEVDKLLTELDRHAPQVRIHVTTGGTTTSLSKGAGVEVGRGRVHAGGGVGTLSSNVETRQNLLVMSGGRGVIHVSRDVAIVAPYQDFAVRMGLLTPSLVFQSVGTGFEVEPVVAGEVVKLRITPWMSFLGTDGTRQVSVTEASTTIAVPSGQSVTINSGGYSQQEKNQAFGLIFGYQDRSSTTGSSLVVRPEIVSAE